MPIIADAAARWPRRAQSVEGILVEITGTQSKLVVDSSQHSGVQHHRIDRYLEVVTNSDSEPHSAYLQSPNPSVLVINNIPFPDEQSNIGVVDGLRVQRPQEKYVFRVIDHEPDLSEEPVRDLALHGDERAWFRTTNWTLWALDACPGLLRPPSGLESAMRIRAKDDPPNKGTITVWVDYCYAVTGGGVFIIATPGHRASSQLSIPDRAEGRPLQILVEPDTTRWFRADQDEMGLFPAGTTSAPSWCRRSE